MHEILKSYTCIHAFVCMRNIIFEILKAVNFKVILNHRAISDDSKFKPFQYFSFIYPDTCNFKLLFMLLMWGMMIFRFLCNIIYMSDMSLPKDIGFLFLAMIHMMWMLMVFFFFLFKLILNCIDLVSQNIINEAVDMLV